MSRDESQRPSAVAVAAMACLMLLPLLLYFGFLGLIYLDEVVLETYHIAENAPEWLLYFLRFIYWPLLPG